jgi:hypothetical protein
MARKPLKRRNGLLQPMLVVPRVALYDLIALRWPIPMTTPATSLRLETIAAVCSTPRQRRSVGECICRCR